MTLERIIVARCVSQNKSLDLANHDAWEAIGLAARISQEVRGRRVYILSSTAPPARFTARNIEDKLYVNSVFDKGLWSDTLHSGVPVAELPRRILEGRQHELQGVSTLVVIGHREHGFTLLTRFAEFLGQRRIEEPRRTLDYGEAAYLCLTSGTLAKL